jgi:hypothetical protein
VLDVLIVIGVSLFQVLCVDRTRKYTRLHRLMFIFISLSIYVYIENNKFIHIVPISD